MPLIYYLSQGFKLWLRRGPFPFPRHEREEKGAPRASERFKKCGWVEFCSWKKWTPPNIFPSSKHFQKNTKKAKHHKSRGKALSYLAAKESKRPPMISLSFPTVFTIMNCLQLCLQCTFLASFYSGSMKHVVSATSGSKETFCLKKSCRGVSFSCSRRFLRMGI